MPVVRRIRSRGATITVESNAEILFMPGGSVHTWTNRFTGRIRAATIAAAPVNKRPRWAHYGKPLKATIVSARPRFWANGRDKQRVYGAVGSTAPHAYYVDQGTGIYAGRGPYEAKVLPPWQRGSASLYESTWRPGGVGTRKVAPVFIKGQQGQFFFAEGLKRGFQSMRLRSFQIPGDPKIGAVLNSVATGLDNFLGNTPNDAGFRASLTEWRMWRDEAWDAGKGLGRGGGIGSRSHAEFVTKARVEAHRKSTAKATKTHNGLNAKAQAALNKAIKKPTKKAPVQKKPDPTKKPKKGWENLRQKQDAALAAFTKQNPNVKVVGRITAGLVVVSPVDKRRYTIPWGRIYPLLPEP